MCPQVHTMFHKAHIVLPLPFKRLRTTTISQLRHTGIKIVKWKWEKEV